MIRPKQQAAAIDTDTFDEEAFVAFATRFRMDPRDVSGSCQANAQVCCTLKPS